jgi:hypothetical protein
VFDDFEATALKKLEHATNGQDRDAAYYEWMAAKRIKALFNALSLEVLKHDD